MRITYFTTSVALRHLRYGVGQSLLTIGVVAISVLLIIYLQTIIGGLQTRLIRNTTGAIPHITLESPERVPIAAWRLTDKDSTQLYVGETVNLPKAQERIEDWRLWVGALDAPEADYVAVSPVVAGTAFMFRGARRQTVRIQGVIPERHNGIVDIESNLEGGRFLQLASGEVAMGRKLARDFGVKLRDKIRLVGPQGQTLSVTVGGIFETGFGPVDDGTLFMMLRDGQSLLGYGTAVSTIGLKLADIYEAETRAADLAARAPFKVRSWIGDNPNLFRNLQSQSQTSNLILVMAVIAAGFGIASILIMSVTGKYREIGILKAMGATPQEIQTIFVIEGFLLAILGCIVGVPVSIGVLQALASVRSVGPDGRSTQIFEIEIDPTLLLTASLIAITTGAIAAFFPARRAGSVDPMQVIRGA
jgi:lipoprotein-releasing system permease protein